MANTPKIDETEVKSQLLKGIAPEAIAKYHGCSRQYVSLIKTRKLIPELERAGKPIPDFLKSNAGRKSKVTTPIKVATAKARHLEDYEWKEHQETLLKTFLMAKEAEQLEEDNNRWRNKYATLEDQHKELQRKYDELNRSQNEYNLLVKRGEITPLMGRK